MEKRKFRRRMLAAAVTAGVLLAVILFNVLFSLLSSRFLWVVDTSPNDLVKISDYSRELLDQIDPESNDITIYFLADPDEVNNYELTGHQSGEANTWGMSYVYNLAKLYEKEYSFISVDRLDTSDDADYIREHFAMTIGTSLNPLTVIIQNDVEGRVTYRTISRDEFFRFSSGVVSQFAGDDKFTSTILSLSGDSPVAYFIEGHGEKVGEAGVADDFGEASALAELFKKAGYMVCKINLADEDFAQSSEDVIASSSATVVVYGPERDFYSNINGVNEITRLRKFLNQKNRNLMVFMDPGVEDMPNLDEYLSDYWGVEFEDNIVIADTTASSSPAVSEDGLSFLGAYELDSSSAGSALTSSLTTLDSLPGALFGKTRTISLRKIWSESNGSFSVSESSTDYKVGATFRAPALSAAVYDGNAGFKCFSDDVYNAYYTEYYAAEETKFRNEHYEQFYQKAYDDYRKELKADVLSDEQIKECEAYAESYADKMILQHMDEYISLHVADASPILTLTHGIWTYDKSEKVPTFMLACGSTAFASAEAIGNAAYANRDTLYTAIYLFGRNIAPYNLDITPIADSSSLSLSDAMATTWTVLLSAVLPLIAVGIGVAVVVKRRKHN